MDKIASFQVDHTTLKPGMYLSRRDGDITTFDLRFKTPNTDDLLSNAELHSAEHLYATLLRNSEKRDGIIYFGPMGCQTGFYLLVDSRIIDDTAAITLMREISAQGINFGGEIPGKSAVECGNYKNLEISLAKQVCKAYFEIIKDTTTADLAY